MIDWNRADSVYDAWPGRQLNAASQHMDQEIIGIADCQVTADIVT
jgi:hypothetical protein